MTTPDDVEMLRAVRESFDGDMAAYARHLRRQIAQRRKRLQGYVNVGRRRAAKRRATPPWADREAIAAVYELAAFLNRIVGGAHVDHIIPLNGKTASGLHVHTNLRVITATENVAKGNKLTED